MAGILTNDVLEVRLQWNIHTDCINIEDRFIIDRQEYEVMDIATEGHKPDEPLETYGLITLLCRRIAGGRTI